MSIDLDQMAARMAAAAGGGFRQHLLRRLRTLSEGAKAEARLNATAGPRVRTGLLRNSIRNVAQPYEQGVEFGLRAGSERGPLTYARLIERGGVVNAVRTTYLAIPLREAKTAAGVLRPEFAVPTLKMVPGLFVLRSRSGTLFLARALGRTAKGRQRTRRYSRGDGTTGRSSLQILFALKGSVRIPAFRYLGRAMDDARTRIPAAMHEALRAATGVDGG